MVTTIGIVRNIVVEDSDKKGTVTLDPLPAGGPTSTFEITRDSDTAFNAMVSALANARTFQQVVTLEHNSGNNKIDKVTY